MWCSYSRRDPDMNHQMIQIISQMIRYACNPAAVRGVRGVTSRTILPECYLRRGSDLGTRPGFGNQCHGVHPRMFHRCHAVPMSEKSGQGQVCAKTTWWHSLVDPACEISMQSLDAHRNGLSA